MPDRHSDRNCECIFNELRDRALRLRTDPHETPENANRTLDRIGASAARRYFVLADAGCRGCDTLGLDVAMLAESPGLGLHAERKWVSRWIIVARFIAQQTPGLPDQLIGDCDVTHYQESKGVRTYSLTPDPSRWRQRAEDYAAVLGELARRELEFDRQQADAAAKAQSSSPRHDASRPRSSRSKKRSRKARVKWTHLEERMMNDWGLGYSAEEIRGFMGYKGTNRVYELRQTATKTDPQLARETERLRTQAIERRERERSTETHSAQKSTRLAAQKIADDKRQDKPKRKRGA